MKFRPGPVLIGLAISAVVFAGASFFAPVAAWVIPMLSFAALVLAAYDWMWLRRNRGNLSVTQLAPQIAGRDVPFEVVLRAKNAGSSPLRGVLRTVVPGAAEPRIWIRDFRREGIEGSQEFRQRFQIATRGQFEFGPVSVALSGPCRAFDAIWEVAGRNRVKVYPGRAGCRGRSFPGIGRRNSDSRPAVSLEAPQRGNRVRVDQRISRGGRSTADRLAGDGPHCADSSCDGFKSSSIRTSFC